MLSRPLLAETHQTTDRGWRGVEDGDFELLNDAPEAVGGGIGGRPFKHYVSRPVHQGTIDDIAVARHPANVGGTPEDISIFDIEDQFGGGIDAHAVAAMNVDDALWLAGATACI